MRPDQEIVVKTARSRAITALVGSLSVMGALLTTVGIAGPAQAHGTMSNPPSRIWECFYGDRTSPLCDEAWKTSPQALYDWNEINQGAANGQHRA
ncbi:MAG: hypothetical protein B7C55_13135, partial [Actinomycetales bacterium mxb001]